QAHPAAVRRAGHERYPRPTNRHLGQLGKRLEGRYPAVPQPLGTQLAGPAAHGPRLAAAGGTDVLVRPAAILGPLRLPRATSVLTLMAGCASARRCCKCART